MPDQLTPQQLSELEARARLYLRAPTASGSEARLSRDALVLLAELSSLQQERDQLQKALGEVYALLGSMGLVLSGSGDLQAAVDAARELVKRAKEQARAALVPVSGEPT